MAAVIRVRAGWLQVPPVHLSLAALLSSLQFSFQSLPAQQPVHTSLTSLTSHLTLSLLTVNIEPILQTGDRRDVSSHREKSQSSEEERAG